MFHYLLFYPDNDYEEDFHQDDKVEEKNQEATDTGMEANKRKYVFLLFFFLFVCLFFFVVVVFISEVS